MTTPVDTPKRGAVLKQLREQHKDSVERTQMLLKEQQAIRRQICQALRDGPKTIPEVAAATGLPASQLLWHITAMKKYDLIREAGLCREYYLYLLSQEAKS
jgi:predicted transcriptional regulator